MAVVLTPVQTKQIIINIHKRNNTKNSVQTIQNTVNTSTHITKATTLVEDLYKKLSCQVGRRMSDNGTVLPTQTLLGHTRRPSSDQTSAQTVMMCIRWHTIHIRVSQPVFLTLHDERVTTHSGSHCRYYCTWADENTHVADVLWAHLPYWRRIFRVASKTEVNDC